ncbi:anthranilate phosphoribosyltransferase, partial [candidate division KSB1 bacterium]
YDRYLANLLAEVLRELETEKALIVYGEDGLDEVSITTSTYLVELSEGNILEKKVTPEDFGLTPSNREEILGGGPEENASIALEILKGKHGPTRDVVIANAACGLYVAGSAASFIEGAKLAAESIDSGAALDKLEQMRRFSNS